MATGGGGSLLLSSEAFYDFSCSNCAQDNKQTEGKSFCVECNETFCTSCLVFHNKIAAMRQHELLDQTKMASRRPREDLVALPTSRCTVHQGQVINMYCGQDDLVCCTVCIAEDHRNCFGVIYIPKKAENIRTSPEFKDVNASIDTLRKDIEMLKIGKTLDLERLTAQHAQIQTSIGKLRDEINKHLDDLEITARKELDKKFKIHEKEINNNIAQIEKQMSKLEETAIQLKDGQNESQLFVDMKQASTKENKRRKLIEDLDISVGKPALHFEPNNDMLKILEIKTLGTLEDQKSFNSVTHYGDFDVSTSGDIKACTITGACQMLNGNIAITDMENYKVKLLDRTYKVVAECELPGRPTNMCRTTPTEIAIALVDNEKVLFAEVSDQISLKGSFNVGEACRGIAYNRGLLYLGCGGLEDDNEGPGQIRVYDMAGKLLQTFMEDKHNMKLFSNPVDIVVSECKTKLHIADRDNGIVTMKLDGTEPWQFTNPSMEFPTAICLVNNDDLLVCGSSSNNVMVFNKKGQQKTILLKKEDGIVCPQSVFYDRPNSRLIVSMWKSNHIKVYTLL